MDNAPEPLDYGTGGTEAAVPEWRVALRYLPVLVATLLLWWSLTLPSHWVISDHGAVVTNERDAVLSMALHPRADNWDLGQYTVRALPLGFYRVDWSGWRRNSRYLLVPKAVFTAGAGLALAGTYLLARRRPASSRPADAI